MTGVPLTDATARKRALSDHATTLMLEAAAGTGKTALIAGRITMMLAAGVAPASIAAVTFGEYAASELNARIAEYVADLLQGRIPKPLQFVFDAPLTKAQETNLERARDELDELTCSTIHGFCQLLLTAHAIDANVDPGARVIDELERQAVLDLVFDAWLEERLSGIAAPDDPIVHLAKQNPRGVVADLKQIAMMRIEHRTAKAPKPDPNARPDYAFAQSVAAFRAWYDAGVAEPRTGAVLADLERLAAFFGTPFAAESSFERLWTLADPPRLAISEEDRDGISRNLVAPSLEMAWRDVAKKEGSALHDEYKRRFSEAAEHYARLVNHVAASIIWRVSNELDGLLEAYQAYKRRAAMLDFEDLLCFARDLVRDNEKVRSVIAARFQHILVDEFQDTDPVQAELLFRIAAEEAHTNWTECVLRPGSLFMVGDPKQAIYGFRGGDIVTYSMVRAAIARRLTDNVLQLTDNFRSRPEIIAHVNACFEQKFADSSQPDYVSLVATLGAADHGLPAAVKIEIEPDGTTVNAIRDKEAAIVADLCRRLIGSYPLGERTLRAGDIALLAPQGTELGRYEQALQAQGIPFVSQAGKTLLKRQEAQDLLALTRTLANRRDFVSFGALMRGPLVGLTETDLLDIAAGLPEEAGRPRFSMFTDAELISHKVARETLATLQDLSAKARSLTPLLILSEALERLRVRATLAERREARGERAWANIEALLERTRPYGVSGLRKFARDFHHDWKAGAGAMEGRLDAEGDALQIITMHSAKGLEWPVVIPINAATQLRRVVRYVYRAADDTLHWIIGGVRAPELAASLRAVEQEQASENVRLWYVACTRAQELLVVPKLEGVKRVSWAALVDLKHAALPAWDIEAFEILPLEAAPERENEQSASQFTSQQARIEANSQPVRWRTPSDADFDRAPLVEALASETTDAPLATPIIGAGSLRGLIMHKLIEEILTGEALEDVKTLTTRARELTRQLAAQLEAKGALPVAEEMASAVLMTLALPEIAAVRPRLLPELSLYAELGPLELLAGRADAIAYDGAGEAEIVFDWKSDSNPTEESMRDHASQLSAYLAVTGAPRGALVYITTRSVRWVNNSA